MKTITLILLIAALNAVVVSAKDYPVLDKDVHLVVRDIADGAAGEHSPFYVLLLPDNNPVIFETFDSKDMEGVIGTCLASGSVVHFDPDPVIGHPTRAQIQGLTDYCKKKGIRLVVSMTQ